MRTLSTARLAACVALALTSGVAIAQSRISTSTTSTGSTVTTSTGGTNTASGGGVVVGGATPPTETLGAANVSSSGANAPASATDAAPATSTDVNRGPDIVITDAGRAQAPVPAPTGAALGRSPGQTSSGVATGLSSAGITPATNVGLGNATVGSTATTGFPSGTTNPSSGLIGGVGVDLAALAAGGAGTTANGERFGAAATGGVTATNTARTPTPVFDATAAQGAAREARRRARGEEPRIIGIAPRTDRDLTHQMPDDPIIRY